MRNSRVLILVLLTSFYQGDYKQLRGMFPHAAGQIASHGPFNSVQIRLQPSDTQENLSKYSTHMFFLKPRQGNLQNTHLDQQRQENVQEV
jgi:hypothetical protein